MKVVALLADNQIRWLNAPLQIKSPVQVILEIPDEVIKYQFLGKKRKNHTRYHAILVGNYSCTGTNKQILMEIIRDYRC